MPRISLPSLALTGAGLLTAAPSPAETPPPAAKVAAPAPAPAAKAPKTAAAQPKKTGRTAARRKDKADKPPPVINGPVAASPSFRMIEDGKSRVFVEVSQKVDVTERKAQGRVIYKLKGAAVPTKNSLRALPTGFFQTPVGQVELVQQADGADLVIELREAAEPTHQVVATPRGGIVIQVDFPRPSGPLAEPTIATPAKRGNSKRIQQKAEPPAD